MTSPVEYRLIRSDRKTLAIQLDYLGNIEVKAPKRAPLAEIETFLRDKLAWLLSKQRQINRQNADFSEIIAGKSVLYFGLPFAIELSESVKTPQILRGKLLLPKNSGENKRPKLIRGWALQNTRKFLDDSLSKFAAFVPVDTSGVTITNAKGNWGSCGTDRKLHFNWRVSMLPPDLADYIVVHEFCHLSQMNHSPEFWRLVERILPNYRKCRALLKQYSFLTALYR